MIISLPDGKEVSLRWRGQVGQWEIALPKRESLWQRVNDAGLNWYFQMSQQKADPHHATRCVRDYPWQCPYGKCHKNWHWMTNKLALVSSDSFLVI